MIVMAFLHVGLGTLMIASILLYYLKKCEKFNDDPYGSQNIKSSEIDLMNVKLLSGGSSHAIDNADSIDRIFNGNRIFQSPDGSITPTQNTEFSVFTLDEGHYNTDYDINQENTNNIDTLSSHMQQHLGSISKRTIDGAVCSTKNIYLCNFEHELSENENCIWWQGDAMKNMKTDMVPYDIIYQM